MRENFTYGSMRGCWNPETTVRSSETLARKGRNSLGSHDLTRPPRQRPTLQTRNILDYLPDGQRPWVHGILRRAYAHDDGAKAWLNRFRRLRVRYEKRADILQAFLSLGCALICWHALRKTWATG
jgi:hypothetical protein